jgi:hypothetical protein
MISIPAKTCRCLQPGRRPPHLMPLRECLVVLGVTSRRQPAKIRVRNEGELWRLFEAAKAAWVRGVRRLHRNGNFAGGCAHWNSVWAQCERLFKRHGIGAVVLFSAITTFGSPITLLWSNTPPYQGYLVSMGNLDAFNYSTNWLVPGTSTTIDSAQLTGALNYFSIQGLEYTNGNFYISGFVNWITFKSAPMLAVFSVTQTATNLQATWTPVATNAPVIVPANQDLQIFRDYLIVTKTNIITVVADTNALPVKTP